MAKLVLTAENFAFGPIGKLLNIASLLKEQGHTLIFAGFGTALQLAKNFPFTTIYQLNTDESASNEKLATVISQADMVISSMDIPSISMAHRLGKLTVWIDCLFWFWDSIPNSILNVDLYIKECSLDDRKNELKYKSKIKNIYRVGPILPKMEQTKRRHQVLVSFGGGEATYWYRAGIDTNYPFIMTKILIDNIDWAEFDRIILATNERIVARLKNIFSQTIFEFNCLPHDKFIKEMLRSEIILITPGLVTSQAAFYSRTPTIFLPASNNSQYLQLEEFRKYDIATASVSLSDFMPRLNLRNKPLNESTKEVLQQLHEFEKSSEIQTRIGIRINELIKNRYAWSDKFVTNGRNFIDSLGGNSTKIVAERISQLLISKGFQ